MSRSALVAGLLLMTGLAGCGGASDAAGDEPPAASTTPSPALLSLPDRDSSDGADPVPVEAGTYLVPSDAWSVADFTVTFPEGWAVQYGHVFAQHGDEEDEFGFYPIVVEEIYADACRGERGDLVEVGPGVQGLVDALLVQPGPTKRGPVRTTLGGYPATRIDLSIPPRLNRRNCFLGPGTGVQIWYSKPADKYFVLLPGAVASVYVLEVDGQRQVFMAQVGNPDSTADLAELQTVLDSLRIKGRA